MSNMRRFAMLACAGFVLAASGCAVSPSGLEFTKDDRMTITSPQQNKLTNTPVMLRWTMTKFDIEGPHAGPVSKDAGYFAIFVDHAPMHPGQTMAALFKNDATCRPIKSCLTKSSLAGDQIYTTTKTSYRLDEIQPIENNVQHEQFHTATIVLMNTAGERIGESAWSVEFKLHANNLDE